ncbi:hypothetical protein [Pseudomonas putida]|uniref:hypothetical protein n=2 Tax=Pseudomonas putida TaxID=303 RepID=UPI0034671C4C
MQYPGLTPVARPGFHQVPFREWHLGNQREEFTMFNMAIMAADECREDAQDRAWNRWIAQARQSLGRYIVDDQGETEEWLHDLYCDGCEPSEAVTEVQCQLGLIEA